MNAHATLALIALFAPPALAYEPPAAALQAGAGLDDGLDDATLDEIERALVPVDPLEPAIINGRQAEPDEWPMAGGLLARITVTFSGQRLTGVLFTCSSTLIAPDVVLTAAHCVDRSLLEMQTGGFLDIEEVTYAWTPEIDLSGFGLGGPTQLPDHAVAGWDLALHPEWVGAADVQIGIARNHDIALIFLEHAVLDRPHAYLPLATEAAWVRTDAPVAIAGWGNQLPVRPGSQPQPGRVGIKHVADSFIGVVGETEFQVGVGPESSRKCQGDSGGPTFLRVDDPMYAEPWRVIGATSHTWDEQLCENTGGVDTRVDYYLDWIDAELRARCADGSRVWCDSPGIVEPPIAEPHDNTDQDEREERRACGCASTSGSGAGLALLLSLAALGRRRRYSS